jgi:tetratricopeptide (TPR) repeat protein
MTRLSKTIIGLGLLACVAVFAYGFCAAYTKIAHKAPDASGGEVAFHLVGFLGSVIVLALFWAFQVSHFWGKRAENWVLQGGEQPEEAAAELEEAERLRKQQQPLEAIRVLRDYLQRHPGELQVMSHIAEIYRDDLHNFLAAALEYEELLQHKLPDEQWGWAALHLTTLYARMNQPEKSLATLERLEQDYGHTLAAKRARERMAKARPGVQPEASEEEAGET